MNKVLHREPQHAESCKASIAPAEVGVSIHPQRPGQHSCNIVYTFCDVRRFLADDTGRISLPAWPTPRPNEHFVRAFGGVKDRTGIVGWVGSDYFCRLHKQVRRIRKYQRDGITTNWRMSFDGMYAGYFEFIFMGACSRGAILRTPIRFRGKLTPFAPKDCGSPLVSQYLMSTTRTTRADDPCPWWIKIAVPLLIGTRRFRSTGEPGYAAITRDGLRVSASRAPSGFSPIEWEIAIDERVSSSRRQALLHRHLRAAITQMHVQRESLAMLLGLIACGKVRPERRSDPCDRLQRSLAKTCDAFAFRRKESRRLRDSFAKLDDVWANTASLDPHTRARRAVLFVDEGAPSIDGSLVAAIQLALEDLDFRPSVRRALHNLLDNGSNMPAPTPDPVPLERVKDFIRSAFSSSLELRELVFLFPDGEEILNNIPPFATTPLHTLVTELVIQICERDILDDLFAALRSMRPQRAAEIAVIQTLQR